METHGVRYAVLLDPFADEDIKKGYYDEQRWINVDIRDNIWLCSISELEAELKSGNETITKKCIASADIKALARYMGIDGEKMYFRAKEFRTGQEKICSYNVFTNALDIEADLSSNEEADLFYIVEEKPFAVFSVSDDKTNVRVRGIVNSNAEISYKSDLGSFVTCIDNRYVITRKNNFNEESGNTVPVCSIYDSENKMHENYECSCYFSGSTLVLY